MMTNLCAASSVHNNIFWLTDSLCYYSVTLIKENYQRGLIQRKKISSYFDETPFVIEALLCSEPQSHLQPYFNLAHGLAQTKDPRILPVLEKLFKLKDVYVSAHNEALGSVFILIYVYGVYGEDGKQSVLKFLNDRDPNCRFNAVALVASLYLDEKAEERLMSIALKDPEPMVRAQAIEYLPDVTSEYFGRREKRVKNLLEDMDNSPDPLIAEKAAAAMKLYKETEQIFLTDLKKGKKIPRNEFSARVKKLISNMGVGIGAEQEDLIATAEIKDLPLLYELREKILKRVSDEGLMDYFNVHGVIPQLKLRSYAKY